MTNRFKMAALALPLMAAIALPASAGTITDVDVNHYQNLTLTGGFLTSNKTVMAGQIVLTTPEGTLGTWCVDLDTYVYLGRPYSYTTSPLSSNNLSSPKTAPLNPGQIDTIQQLAAFGNAVLGGGTAISDYLVGVYAAGLDAFADATGSAADAAYLRVTSTGNRSLFSAALQASIWFAEYGTTVVNPSSAFTSMLAAIELGRTYFDNIGGYQLNLADASGAPAQRLYTPEVPEPASMALLGFGLLLLFTLARRKASA